MLKNKFYVYVYLNPLKPGNYTYLENGIGIDFEYAPFYIGKGEGRRIYKHLNEAEKFSQIEEEFELENIEGINWHKINTINKIHREGKEVIIYKICENIVEEFSYNLERFLIKLIGRSDLKLGILTNMTDGGEGTFNRTKESYCKRAKKRKETYNNDPTIMKNQINNRKITEQNNPEIQIQRTKTHKQTMKDDPTIIENRVLHRLETEKNNPEIQIQRTKTFLQTLKNDPSIMKNASIKQKQTLKNDPNIKINSTKKGTETKIKNNIGVGKSHPLYKKIDHKFLIIEYFKINSSKLIVEIYNQNHQEQLTIQKYNGVLKILNFPTSTIVRNYPKEKQIYLNFIKENKYKIDWYIENYERLEEEYWNKIHYERHKELIDKID